MNKGGSVDKSLTELIEEKADSYKRQAYDGMAECDDDAEAMNNAEIEESAYKAGFHAALTPSVLIKVPVVVNLLEASKSIELLCERETGQPDYRPTSYEWTSAFIELKQAAGEINGKG